MSFSDYIETINSQIREIKEFGLQPVTLKSPANIIEKFVEPKGSSNEGEFKTYDQYIEQYGFISEEDYENYISSFITDYIDQFDLRGAIKWQSTAILDRLEGEIDPYYYERLADMAREDLIELVQKAGMQANEAVRNGYDSDVYYHYLIQYIEEYDKF